MRGFRHTEWGGIRPLEAKTAANGTVIVARNVREEIRDGATVYVGEEAIMTPEAYSAYIGAQQAETRRENDVIDEYTMELIEKGIL